MSTNYSEAVRLLIKVAKLGEEIWDESPVFLDGYKKIDSGLLCDIRIFLRDKECIDLKVIDEEND